MTSSTRTSEMSGIGLVADPDLARVEILQDMRAWVVDGEGRLREDVGE